MRSEGFYGVSKNNAGQLHSVTETKGKNVTDYLYQYDTLGNLVGSEKFVGGLPMLRTWHSYDNDNRLSSQGWQIGADSFSQTYAYDTWDGNLSSMQSATGQTLTYGYDGLRRLTTMDTSLYEKSYTYRNLEDGRTTGQVSSVTYDLPTDQSFAYTYDNMGNIVTYTDANGTVTYTYDDLGQLLSASNGYTYSYDNAGNILSANGHTYTYGDSSWADLLTAVDGEAITYDAIGNPTSYYNGTRWSFDWARGRQLATASNGTDTISYTYDADGLRTGKTIISPLDNSQKNGLFVDSDGETRYYVDGVAAYAGLVYWDGYFYYFNSSLKAVRNRTYWPTNTNGLIPVAEYTFDENGRITNPPVVGIDAQGQLKNGIYADADGEIRYYVDGIATYAKLVYVNGHYYYIDSSLKAVRDTTYYVTHPNGLMAAGSYTFDAQGRMIDPPEDALTEAISTFALSGETMSKTYDYVYASGTLMRQVLTVTIGNSTTTYAMDFFYDASGYPFAVKYNGDLCYYITNLQGDVMSIVDAQGEVVAEYEYDPYGNIVSQSGPLAEANPLRYRGYVYDTETTLYYLQSRYYDPELGRFINADAYASTGQGILGDNMFAYCNNNPINYTDPSGTISQAYLMDGPLFSDKQLMGGGGGYCGVGNYSIQASKRASDSVIANEIAFFTNTSEAAVLEAENFAFYKGRLVIRTNGNRSGSFGILFITRETNSRPDAEDVIRHEYGHTIQLKQLGIVKYALCIGIPSLFEWGSDPEYYRRPWEITADIYGNVQSRSYPGYEDAGFQYLENSGKWGIFVWFTIE